MTDRTVNAALLALLATLAGCGACDTVPTTAVEDCSASQVVALPVQTDILFVIDSSGSMAEEQTTLQAGLATFIDTLAASAVDNDFQIGVTTTSVMDFNTADDGTLGGVLVPPGIMVAADPALVTKFESAVVVGTSGYGREQPFTAVRRAIEKSAPGGVNQGFLRPGAKLAIVFLSDEDDCSGTASLVNNTACRTQRTADPSSLVPVSDVAAFLSGPLLGEDRAAVVAAIVGVAPGSLDLACVTADVCSPTPPPACPTCCGTALDYGERFVQLLTALGPGRTRLASICDASFADSLKDIANAILGNIVPLDGAPADWRMLAAKVTKAAGGEVACKVASASDSSAADIAAADAVYTPPQMGGPSLTFQGDCVLSPTDRIDLSVICVR